MIKTVIIDDEQDSREALVSALSQYCPGVCTIRVCDDAQAGIDTVKEIHPDLIFLDVQMPGMTGFDVLKELNPLKSQVVFVSAYDRYAIKAIRFSAVDYLLKPVDVSELIEAVRRVEERLEAKETSYRYESVVNNVQYKLGKIDRLAVPDAEGVEFFDTQNIIYCEAEGNYTTLYLTGNKKRLISRKLKEFENLLSESAFCRVHHSSLINMQHLQKYVRGEGGYALLSEGHHVDISRRRKEEFLSRLHKL